MHLSKPLKVELKISNPKDPLVQDIEFRLKGYPDMNLPPFEVKELKVQ